MLILIESYHLHRKEYQSDKKRKRERGRVNRGNRKRREKKKVLLFNYALI